MRPGMLGASQSGQKFTKCPSRFVEVVEARDANAGEPICQSFAIRRVRASWNMVSHTPTLSRAASLST